MNGEWIIWFFVGSPVILWVGMLYGDYKEGEWKPFWQRKERRKLRSQSSDDVIFSIGIIVVLTGCGENDPKWQKQWR